MKRKLTPAECFETIKESILSIPENRTTSCTVNNARVVQEGNRVTELAIRHRAALYKSGIDPVYPDTIVLRAGTYAHCVASEEVYVTKSVTRKEMLVTMPYIFRDNFEAFKMVDSIGSGRNDMEMNLLSLYKVYKKYGKLKSIPEHDMAAIVRLKTLHEELTDIAALIKIDPQMITEASKTCAKAWTFLWEAMREIYSAGQYVFRKQPQTKLLFYSRPFQKIRGMRKTSTNSKAKKSTEIAGKNIPPD